MLVISTHSLTKRLTIENFYNLQRTGISTHSLTKRLTHQVNIYFFFLFYFNSQPHEEADAIRKYENNNYRLFQLTASRRGWHSKVVCCCAIFIFQLTASRRGWLYPSCNNSLLSNFNSQPHEEADCGTVTTMKGALYISTHSLTKRLTRNIYRKQ